MIQDSNLSQDKKEKINESVIEISERFADQSFLIIPQLTKRGFTPAEAWAIIMSALDKSYSVMTRIMLEQEYSNRPEKRSEVNTHMHKINKARFDAMESVIDNPSEFN